MKTLSLPCWAYFHTEGRSFLTGGLLQSGFEDSVGPMRCFRPESGGLCIVILTEGIMRSEPTITIAKKTLYVFTGYLMGGQ